MSRNRNFTSLLWAFGASLVSSNMLREKSKQYGCKAHKLIKSNDLLWADRKNRPNYCICFRIYTCYCLPMYTLYLNNARNWKPFRPTTWSLMRFLCCESHAYTIEMQSSLVTAWRQKIVRDWRCRKLLASVTLRCLLACMHWFHFRLRRLPSNQIDLAY